MKPVETKNPIVHAVLLGAIAFVASLFLVLGNVITWDSIQLRKYEDLVNSLAIVIPSRLHDNDLTKDVIMVEIADGEKIKVHRARKGDAVTAVAFERFVHGYAKIHLVMGIDAKGEVLGVRVLAHEETPGLGDQIEIRKSDWVKSFDGLSLANTPLAKWGVKKDGGIFDQFTGATITPRAVVKSVREGLEFFRDRKSELLSNKPVAIKQDNKRKFAEAGGADR